MHVIYARNVNEALVRGLTFLKKYGVAEETRNGRALVAASPVTTTYWKPMERVLFSPARDANPFFHLFEALWMLAGRRDAAWLDQFVKDYSARFAEKNSLGEVWQHGAYGYRWRNHFAMEGEYDDTDQLDTVVEMLRKNPQDRRVVITMWDPTVDLNKPEIRDLPCNTHIYPRVRYDVELITPVLDITVCCRSNDLVWGLTGANAVHFSVLQEYLAARIGVGVGMYYQVSNNFHTYDATTNWAVLDEKLPDPYVLSPVSTPIVTVPEVFDEELQRFMSEPNTGGGYRNTFFDDVAAPLYRANKLRRSGNLLAAALELTPPTAAPPDWVLAARMWLQRRITKKEVARVRS